MNTKSAYSVDLKKEGGNRMSVDLEDHYDKLYRYCFMRLKHPQAAEDAVQETFLRFLENYSYREMGKKLAYLYTIARNLCIDQYRKKPEYPLKEETEGREEDLLETLALRQALLKLNEEERELIFLRYVNEVAVNDIGKILGISRFSVRRRLLEALKKLRSFME